MDRQTIIMGRTERAQSSVERMTLLSVILVATPVASLAQWQACGSGDVCLPSARAVIGSTAPNSGTTKFEINANNVPDAVGLVRFTGLTADQNTLLTPVSPGGTQGWKLQSSGGSLTNFLVTDVGNNAKFVVDVGSAFAGVGTWPSKNLQVHSTSYTTMYISSHAPGVAFGDNASYFSAQGYGAIGLSSGGNWSGSSQVGDLVLMSGPIVSGAGGNIHLATNGTPVSPSTTRLLITNGGNVGIGTLAPAATLDVNGDVHVSGNIAAKYQDVAEWAPARQAFPVGTVVTLDRRAVNQVEASRRAYDTTVAGVITDQPGVLLGEGGEGKVKVATTGRVRVQADTSHGPIQIGDLLVTGAHEGVAARSVPVEVAGVLLHRPGTVVGKALEPLQEGRGGILVLLTLQ